MSSGGSGEGRGLLGPCSEGAAASGLVGSLRSVAGERRVRGRLGWARRAAEEPLGGRRGPLCPRPWSVVVEGGERGAWALREAPGSSRRTAGVKVEERRARPRRAEPCRGGTGKGGVGLSLGECDRAQPPPGGFRCLRSVKLAKGARRVHLLSLAYNTRADECQIGA